MTEIGNLSAGDPRHGTANGYLSHACRCEPCRLANREFCRLVVARMRARGAADPAVIPHGSDYAYCKWACRCPRCREAHRLHRRAEQGGAG